MKNEYALKMPMSRVLSNVEPENKNNNIYPNPNVYLSLRLTRRRNKQATIEFRRCDRPPSHARRHTISNLVHDDVTKNSIFRTFSLLL